MLARVRTPRAVTLPEGPCARLPAVPETDYPEPIRRVVDAAARKGVTLDIHVFDESTHTADEAARAVGAELGQIVKSLVFVDTEAALLCLCAGDRRVDPAKLGDGVRQARGDEVREATGFSIGGVPPLGHDRPLRTVVDESLRRFDTVWCAGGTPHAVFPVETEALIRALPDADVREVA
jgi:prolyl-tRNA editing enzyme YbaK/EbsC (Cys-tRNA(Pro) deacylase)